MRILYNPTTGQFSPDPRTDGGPIVGLEPALVVLEVIQQPPPPHDPNTQKLEMFQIPNLENLTLTRGWEVVSLPLPAPLPDWKTFKRTLMSDNDINSLLGGGLTQVPAAAIALPTTVINSSEGGDLSDFRAAWIALRRAGLVPQSLINKVRVLAIQCNMPDSFLAAIGGTLRPSPEFVGQEWISSEGILWVVIQARGENGQFLPDDPNTPEKESLMWVQAE